MLPSADQRPGLTPALWFHTVLSQDIRTSSLLTLFERRLCLLDRLGDKIHQQAIRPQAPTRHS